VKPGEAGPRGLEPGVKSAPSRDNVVTDGDGGKPARPADASSDVSTEADAHDGNVDRKSLPALTTGLFVMAGAVVAERLACADAKPSQVEEVLQRVIEQCFALTR